MLLVKTKIGPSSVHGIGLFADQFITKGTVTWQYDPAFDLGITKAQLEALPHLKKEFFVYYSYYDDKKDLFIIPMDHLRFINHTSKEENLTIDSTPDQDIAHRDIQPGEEMLCNYNKFDPIYFDRLHIHKENLK